MHFSAMNGLIGIRIILGHYDAMAIKGDFLQITCKGDDENVISSWRVSEYSGVAAVHGL